MDWGCQYEKANNLERMLMAERVLLMAYVITLVCMTEIFVYLLIIENQVNFDMYVHGIIIIFLLAQIIFTTYLISLSKKIRKYKPLNEKLINPNQV
jgi:divalent metal cation (Fe/Co/Zn/Cd) transporter